MRVPDFRRVTQEEPPTPASASGFQLGPIRVALPSALVRHDDPRSKDGKKYAARVNRGRRNNGDDGGGIFQKLGSGIGSVGGAIKGVGNFQQNLMTNMAVKVIAGVSGTLSGLLLAGLAYKVVGGYQDEMKEARREVQKQHAERKARLASVRRLLSGPLRAAARDLRNRLKSILQTAPRRRAGEPPKIRANYFAAHYPDNPNEAVNSTLFRLCRYLHWVEQFQRGVQLEGVSEQDTWQYALDVQLDRVATAFEASIDRYDATIPTERLVEVLAHAHMREVEQGDENADGKQSIFRRIDGCVNETSDLSDGTMKNKKTQRRLHGLECAEPQERLSRFPMRLFRDTQVAVAEVFGKLDGHMDPSSSGLSEGNKVNHHMLYTEFVMKLEEAQLTYERFLEQEIAESGGMTGETVLAAQQDSIQADPWFRWMLPLQLQIRRLAMLQSQTSKLLTRKESRELLAARARLRGVLQGLDGLLDVLDKRLDDPMFNKPKTVVKGYFSAKSESKKHRMNAIKSAKALKRWYKIRQCVPYVARYQRMPPPPVRKGYLDLLSGKRFMAMARRYKQRAIAGVISAVSTAVFTALLSHEIDKKSHKELAGTHDEDDGEDDDAAEEYPQPKPERVVIPRVDSSLPPDSL